MAWFKAPGNKGLPRGEIGVGTMLNLNHQGPVGRPTEKNARIDEYDGENLSPEDLKELRERNREKTFSEMNRLAAARRTNPPEGQPPTSYK